MEPSPAVAWVLVLTLISDWPHRSESRDFTEKDIVCLHPSATPFPGAFKCFTCENATDNYSCNRWAPDEYCPQESSFCYTRHQMDESGASVSVTKLCVSWEACLSTGCTSGSLEGHKVCVSCCEGSICNLPLPRNESDAVFTTMSPLSQGSHMSLRPLVLSLALSLSFSFLLNSSLVS